MALGRYAIGEGMTLSLAARADQRSLFAGLTSIVQRTVFFALAAAAPHASMRLAVACASDALSAARSSTTIERSELDWPLPDCAGRLMILAEEAELTSCRGVSSRRCFNCTNCFWRRSRQ